MKYCCHAWAVALNWSSDMLGSPAPAASHRNVVASLSLCLLGRCLCESTEVFPLPYSCGRSSGYSDKLHDFSVTIPRSYENVNINSFSLVTVFLGNSWSEYCFPLLVI